MSKWPEYVYTPKGLSPGETRLVRKVTGVSVDALEADDQIKVMAFAALVRLYRNPETNELSADPAELWEAAEWVEVRPAEDERQLTPLGDDN